MILVKRISVFLYLAVFIASNSVVAQVDNLGKYRKVTLQDGTVVYEKYWSTYIEGIENEPAQEGDLNVHPYSGSDPGGPGPPEMPHFKFTGLSFFFDDDDDDEDPVLRLPRYFAFGTPIDPHRGPNRIFVFRGAPWGSPYESPDWIGRDEEEEPDDRSDPCEEGELGDELADAGLTTEQVSAALDFLNSNMARGMWLDSLPNIPMAFLRLEQGGLLIPTPLGGYYSWRAGEDDINYQNQCEIFFDPPPGIGDGIVPIHTHPYGPTDTLYCPGGPAEYDEDTGPSPIDINNFPAGSPFGIILAKDKVHFYNGSGSILSAERCGY